MPARAIPMLRSDSSSATDSKYQSLSCTVPDDSVTLRAQLRDSVLEEGLICVQLDHANAVQN